MDPDFAELVALDKLKKEGIITNDEFDREKKKILSAQVPHGQLTHNKYAGFLQRLGSHLIDMLIVIPIGLLTIWGNEQSKMFVLYSFLPILIFSLWYRVYLVKQYGGTPGKLILNIKITKLDETDVGYREAIIRESIMFALTICLQIYTILAVLDMTEAEYFKYDWITRGEAIMEYSPMWYFIILMLSNVWVYGEFIVMLTNEKRRAIHDFMAGTVVINKKVQQIPVNQAQWHH